MVNSSKPAPFAIWTPERWYSAHTPEEAQRIASRYGGSVLGPGFGQNGAAAHGCGR